MEQEDSLTSPLAMMDDSAGSLCTYKPLDLEVQVVDFLSSYTVRGVLEGFTPGEVTILVGEPVDEQRMVTVRLNSFSFEGQTLYCGPRADQFEVHISIDDA